MTGTRITAPSLGAPGKPVTAGDMAAFVEQLRALPIVNGRELTVTFTGGTTVEVKHGLGRAYRNVLIGEQQNTAKIVNVGISSDPKKLLKLVSSAATSMTVKVWVY